MNSATYIDITGRCKICGVFRIRSKNRIALHEHPYQLVETRMLRITSLNGEPVAVATASRVETNDIQEPLLSITYGERPTIKI